MRKLLILLPLLLALTTFGLAQGSSIYGQVVQPAPPAGTGGPAANALVRVCPISGSGVPCTPTANLFADQTLTSPISNPYTADQYGNYSVFVATGTYLVQISPIASVTYSYLVFANGSATVSSVGVTMPNIFTVTGSPVTTAGTIAATLNSQAANTVFAGPASGGGATPTFRALVIADLSPFVSGSGSVLLTGTGSYTLNDCIKVGAAGNLIDAGGVCGTVTSVNLTVPTPFAVSGGPITGSGTLAITANFTGTGTLIATGSGAYVNGHTVIIDANGNLVDSGSAPLVPGGGSVTSVAATVPPQMTISGSPITTTGTLAFGLHTTGAATNVVTSSAPGTTGNCALWSSGNLADSGGPCPPLYPFNFSTCSTGSSQLDECQGTASLPVTFADTAYDLTCTMDTTACNASNPPCDAAISIRSRTTSSITYGVIALTIHGPSAGGTARCIVSHP